MTGMSTLRMILTSERDFMKGANLSRGRVSQMHYFGPQDLILREGTEYTKVEPYDFAEFNFVGEVQQCYQNALELALANPEELTYVEGYGLRMIPCPHAWVIRLDGTVLDPTWQALSDLHGPDVFGGEEIVPQYIGIPFAAEFVDEYTERRGVYGVTQDWQQGYPLCQNPLPPTRPVYFEEVLSCLSTTP